jgi:ABC-type Fe3+-hydroxamate transport system substrate-binding protein
MTRRDDTAALPEPGHPRKALTRRRLLKSAIATAPAIVTLPSGAALARSSNLITASSPAEALDAFGNTLCLDLNSGTIISGDGFEDALDLGDPPEGYVTAISPRQYFISREADPANVVSETEMCELGGTFHYQNPDWVEVHVPQGMLVSATALASFGGYLAITEI